MTKKGGFCFLVLATAVLLSLAGCRENRKAEAAREWSKEESNLWSDLKLLQSILMVASANDKTWVMPALDSRNSNYLGLLQEQDRKAGLHTSLKRMQETRTRSWAYFTPKNLVGKRWDDFGDEAVVMRVAFTSAHPTGETYSGITKVGSMSK